MLELSLVVPVHNEARLLEESIRDLCHGLRDWGRSFEIILAENGSTDDTARLAEQLAREVPEVRLIRVPGPNYGRALREGILETRGRLVHCDEIDICDLDFHRRAFGLLTREPPEWDLVIGSKAMAGAHDQRPWLRRVATRAITGLLRVMLGYRGTDTHGLKAFQREPLLPIVKRCVVDKDMFASELVVRAQRAGQRIVEIPLTIKEKREPSLALWRRVPRVLYNLLRLWWVIHVTG